MWGYERYKGNLYLPLSFVNKPKTAIKKKSEKKDKTMEILTPVF